MTISKGETEMVSLLQIFSTDQVLSSAGGRGVGRTRVPRWRMWSFHSCSSFQYHQWSSLLSLWVEVSWWRGCSLSVASDSRAEREASPAANGGQRGRARAEPRWPTYEQHLLPEAARTGASVFNVAGEPRGVKTFSCSQAGGKNCFANFSWSSPGKTRSNDEAAECSRVTRPEGPSGDLIRMGQEL